MIIELDDDRFEYAPGDVVGGWVVADDDCGTGTIALMWRAEGKGGSDTGIGAECTLAPAKAGDRRRFELVVPPRPYTFHGKLLSISWAVQLGAVEIGITVKPV